MPQRWRCPDCSALYGAWLSGCPRCQSEKELTLALNKCAGCTTSFAVGLPCCPQCRSTDFAEQGQDMPKITAHGGASNAAEPQLVTTLVGEPGPELELPFGGAAIATSGAWAEEPEPDAVEAETSPEEESSPGSSSSTSSETPPTEPEPSGTPRPKRARTTGSRSKKAPTESSSAPGTDGDPAADTSTADEAGGE